MKTSKTESTAERFRILPATLFFTVLLLLTFPLTATALGNHPESSTCQQDSPWYAVCTSSVHSLEGWTGNCFKTRTEAEQEAKQHSDKIHNGITRWTGVRAANSL